MAGPSFYKTVVPLDRERHRNLKLRSDRGAAFAAGSHMVPVAAVEFHEAARDYPVVFAGSEDANPLAVLGLRADENLFVGADGWWAKGAYVPVFVRRYPFILSRTGEASTDFAVCIDESFDGFSETEGHPLFDDDGKESQLVNNAVSFLRDFLTETERTRRFVERLRALDLLIVQSMQFQDAVGRTFALRDFRMVDESKLKALDDGVIGELNRSGYLGCIYAHLISLGNLARLASLVPVEQGASQTQPSGEGAAEPGPPGGEADPESARPGGSESA